MTVGHQAVDIFKFLVNGLVLDLISTSRKVIGRCICHYSKEDNILLRKNQITNVELSIDLVVDVNSVNWCQYREVTAIFISKIYK